MSAITLPTTAFMTCPTCAGLGQIRTNRCTNCNGLGLGAFQGDRFIYFNAPLSLTTIRLSAARRVMEKAITIIASVLGALGIISLGWWFYVHGDLVNAFTLFTASSLRSLRFWEAHNGFVLLFWLSLIPDLFLIYRHVRRRDNAHHVISPAYAKAGAPILNLSWEELTKRRRIALNAARGTDAVSDNILDQSFILASNFKHSQIEPLHLFAATVMISSEVSRLWSRLGLSEQKLTSGIEHQLSSREKTGEEPVFSALAREVMVEAYTVAAADGRHELRAIDLLVPCVNRDEKLAELLYDLEIDTTKLTNAVAWFHMSGKLAENYQRYRAIARYKPSTNMDRAYTALATPLLDQYSYDWTLAAKWGRVELCVARDKETRQLFDAIESGKTGLLLVGPEGVGKTTLVGGLAQLMVLEEVPQILQDKRLIELDVARLIGGSDAAGAEGRLLEVIGEINRARNIILYIKNIEKIMGISSGSEESLDLASVLADAVSRGALFCIASVTDEHHAKFVENTPIASAFMEIEVKEPETNDAILMIESKVAHIEHQYGVSFSYNAISEVVSLTGKYMHDSYLPAKAVDILEAVAVVVSRREDKMVDREAIAAVITERTHIPVTKLTESESANLLNLETKIHERMIGQEEAVKMVASALRRARVELRENKRPIANFLFLGPTGVGKTELAKTVAETYFGREDYMIRLDMSEYQNEDSVNKMIGSPEGVLGYLTEAVRKLPFSLILLDELEKAHPDILNLFLQVMDDGRLTDGQGRTIDFTNSILIATSNVGSALIQEKVRDGVDLSSIKEQLIQTELVKAMRPELINRFDGVIVFTPLDQSAVVAIAKLLLKKIAKMVESKGYVFSISEIAITKLAELGFQPEFGARPLRRLLQERVEDAIATKILEGGIKRRDTIVVNDDLSISITQASVL